MGLTNLCRRSISSSASRAGRSVVQDQVAGARRLPVQARRLPAGQDDDAQEAELGPAEGRPRAALQRQGSHRLHPRRRAQPAGALDRARPRRPRPRPARRALPHRPRRARHASASTTASRPAPSTAPSAKGAAPAKGAKKKSTASADVATTRTPHRQTRPLDTTDPGLIAMARKFTASKTQLKPDPRFGSKLASKFINCLMYDGKKSVAQRVFYDAMDLIKKRLPEREPDRRLHPGRRERQADRSRSAPSASAAPPTRCRCRSTRTGSRPWRSAGS